MVKVKKPSKVKQRITEPVTKDENVPLPPVRMSSDPAPKQVGCLFYVFQSTQ